jgi:hypothetical protein
MMRSPSRQRFFIFIFLSFCTFSFCSQSARAEQSEISTTKGIPPLLHSESSGSHVIFSAPASDSSVTAGNGKIPPPKTASEILQRIREIVDHGDLADEEFYAERLGVGMVGTKLGEIRVPDKSCGPAMGGGDVRKEIGQYFYYSKIPKYFDEYYGRRSDCDRPFLKVTKEKGVISVSSEISIDTRAICILEGDVKKYFPSAIYSEYRGMMRMKYAAQNNQGINLEMESTWQQPRCIDYIGFHQAK